MVPQSWRVGSIEPAGRPPAQINGGHVRLSQERPTHRIRLIGELHTFFRCRVKDGSPRSLGCRGNEVVTLIGGSALKPAHHPARRCGMSLAAAADLGYPPMRQPSPCSSRSAQHQDSNPPRSAQNQAPKKKATQGQPFQASEEQPASNVLQSRNTLFNRRVRGKQSAHTTGYTQSRH